MVLVYLYLFHFLLSHVLVFIILLERLRTIIIKTNHFHIKVEHIIKVCSTSFYILNVLHQLSIIILISCYKTIYLIYLIVYIKVMNNNEVT